MSEQEQLDTVGTWASRQSEQQQPRCASAHLGLLSFPGTGALRATTTHPDMRPVQSGTDIAGMAGMVAGAGQNQRRALMLIFGREKGRAAAGVYVYESQGAGPVGELVTVESGAMELATKVV